MKRLIFGLLIWFAIVGVLGAFARYAFGINFWIAVIIAGLALIANGLFAELEDWRPGGLYNPHSKKDL